MNGTPPKDTHQTAEEALAPWIAAGGALALAFLVGECVLRDKVRKLFQRLIAQEAHEPAAKVDEGKISKQFDVAKVEEKTQTEEEDEGPKVHNQAASSDLIQGDFGISDSRKLSLTNEDRDRVRARFFDACMGWDERKIPIEYSDAFIDEVISKYNEVLEEESDFDTIKIPPIEKFCFVILVKGGPIPLDKTREELELIETLKKEQPDAKIRLIDVFPGRNVWAVEEFFVKMAGAHRPTEDSPVYLSLGGEPTTRDRDTCNLRIDLELDRKSFPRNIETISRLF